MGKKREVTDGELFLLMVEELGIARALQVLGYALVAWASGAEDLNEFREMVERNGLYSEKSYYNMKASVRRVRAALMRAEGGDPGTVWELLRRMARLRDVELPEKPAEEGLTA